MISQLNEWYEGKKVFVTGHTGFKGAWLAGWLNDAGSTVTGYALAPPEGRPNLFQLSGLTSKTESVLADICDRPSLDSALASARPDIVFHLAAQSLVRRSYHSPVETYQTNVMGTVNVLDAIRSCPSVKAVVIVTSDKCYDNSASDHPFTEESPMGGRDPYSSSKGCAELVTAAFRNSFFSAGVPAIASARAGNVIGPGDWAEDRLVPDLVIAAENASPATIRNPASIRPWQFVLEPLRGYLMLGRALYEGGPEFASAWNFGPREEDFISVEALVERVQRTLAGLTIRNDSNLSFHEERSLRLDSRKAHTLLGWKPVMTLERAIEITLDGYMRISQAGDATSAMMSDILRSYWRTVTDATND